MWVTEGGTEVKEGRQSWRAPAAGIGLIIEASMSEMMAHVNQTAV